jgi:hypothetical protein
VGGPPHARVAVVCRLGKLGMIALQLEPRLFKYWALLNDLLPKQASSPGCRHPPPDAPDFPYRLEVRRGGSKLPGIPRAGDESAAVDCIVLQIMGE